MNTGNEKLIIETIEDVKKLEVLADEAYDNEEYEKAAEHYYEVLKKVQTGNDVKKIAECYYLYGISLCQAKEYDKGLEALEESYKLEYKINGGAENETKRAIKESIYGFCLEDQDKLFQPDPRVKRENQAFLEYAEKVDKCVKTNRSDRALKKLFEIYEDLRKTDDINGYADQMMLRYEEFMDAPPYKAIRHTSTENGSVRYTTEPDYEEWFLHRDSLCKFLEITKDVERLIRLSKEYIDRWQFLLKRLDNDIVKWNKKGIYTEYLFGVWKIGHALDELKMFGESSVFYSQCLQDLNMYGFPFYVGYPLWHTYYIYAISLSEINKPYDGLELLQNCCSNMLEMTDAELKEANETFNRTFELGTIYTFLGHYYQYALKDYKKAIEVYEKAIAIGCFEPVADLGRLYIIVGVEKAKKLYQGILMKHQEQEITNETIVLCMERLAAIAKWELKYAKAAKLYEQLLEDNPDPFERQKYRIELYRCMAYTEVDTLEALEELEKYFEQRNVLESQESLETIQDINALAAGYVSYANHLQEENEEGAQEYMRRGKDTYQKFFALSEPLLDEAIRNNNRRDILPHIKEYDRTLQRYLELIEKDNINEMFECVIKYQSFAFEVERLLAQKNTGSFKQDNLINKLKQNLQDGDCIINYVLFYEKDIRRYGAFILQKDTPIRFYKLKDEEQVKVVISTFRKALFDRNIGEEAFCKAREALLQELLPQLIMPEEIKKVYIVRAHGLEGIPFHLLTGTDTRELVSAASYLDKYEKELDYSRITVFSNPEFEVEPYETKEEKYNLLEGSRLEGNLIRSIYLHEETESYDGVQANVRQFKRTIKESKSDILHISSHHVKFYSEEKGYMDSSKLILAGANNLTKDKEFTNIYGEDGTISAAEISRIDMKKRLIVLAACKTGSGAVVEGGGLYGLSRAFYQHGCKVVSTLYDIGDYPTAVFFKFFYESLQEYNDPNKSIIYAREKMRTAEKGDIIGILKDLKGLPGTQMHRGNSINKHIRDIRMDAEKYPYSHPYFWAGFIIGGK